VDIFFAFINRVLFEFFREKTTLYLSRENTTDEIKWEFPEMVCLKLDDLEKVKEASQFLNSG